MKKIVSIVIISALIITMGAFSVFANNIPDMTAFRYSGTFQYQDRNLGGIRVDSLWSEPYLYYEASTSQYTPSVENYHALVRQDYFITVYIYNNTSDYMRLPNYSYVQFALTTTTTTPSQYSSWSIDPLNDSYVYISSNDRIQVYLWDLRADDGNYYLPPYTTWNYTFKMQRNNDLVAGSTYVGNGSDTTLESVPISGVTFYQPVFTNNIATVPAPSTDNPGVNQEYWNVKLVEQHLQNILDAYSYNVENAEALVDQTEANEQTMETIHNSESNFYQQNSEALQAAGLSNYQFDSTTATGLGSIRTFMTTFWNNTSPYTSTVVTFSLMITLTTHILRHSPRGHKSKSSGSSGGNSNGSSS